MEAFVERDCAFEFEGKTFEAGGAVVTAQHAIGYLSDDMREIRTWHGDRLGVARVVRSWPMRHSWVSSRQYQVEATINGRTYTGRTMGAGMLWRGRPKAR